VTLHRITQLLKKIDPEICRGPARRQGSAPGSGCSRIGQPVRQTGQLSRLPTAAGVNRGGRSRHRHCLTPEAWHCKVRFLVVRIALARPRSANGI